MQNHLYYSPTEFKSKFHKSNICCIFGGSFDPIHEGHIRDIRTLLDLSSTVIIAPTAQNPWKPDQSSALRTRLEMIELVLNAEGISFTKNLNNIGLILSDLEYHFSIELDKAVKQERDSIYPSESIYWAIGEDLRDSAHKWKDWDHEGSDFLVLPTLEGFSGTAVRNQKLDPHPAISQFIKNHRLYN